MKTMAFRAFFFCLFSKLSIALHFPRYIYSALHLLIIFAPNINDNNNKNKITLETHLTL
jgi:hypothetical protein